MRQSTSTQPIISTLIRLTTHTIVIMTSSNDCVSDHTGSHMHCLHPHHTAECRQLSPQWTEYFNWYSKPMSCHTTKYKLHLPLYKSEHAYLDMWWFPFYWLVAYLMIQWKLDTAVRSLIHWLMAYVMIRCKLYTVVLARLLSNEISNQNIITKCLIEHQIQPMHISFRWHSSTGE